MVSTPPKSKSAKAAEKGKGSSPSPRRKIKKEAPTQMKKGNTPTLYVIAFPPPLTVEAYYFEKPNGDEAYTFGFKDYHRSHDDDRPISMHLVDANFIGSCDRRVPDTNNEPMRISADNEYARIMMLRYAKGANGETMESTPESRQQGLRALEAFFKDSRFQRYPPRAIQKVDLTDPENYKSLDHFFMDEQIQTLLIEDLVEEDINPEFYTTYDVFAKQCWRYNHVSTWAQNTLGFPT